MSRLPSTDRLGIVSDRLPLGTPICTILRATPINVVADGFGGYCAQGGYGTRGNLADLIAFVEYTTLGKEDVCDDCGNIHERCRCNDIPVDFYAQLDYDGEYGDLMDDFADPGGNSALRAATPTNPRIHPCPNCNRENMLTPKDVALGYQCDYCADAAERGYDC